MYKAKLNNNEKEILFELLKLLAETDGNVTHDEMDMIYQLKDIYSVKEYEYRNYSQNVIRSILEDMNENSVLNILTHAVLLGLSDGIFDPSEQELIRSFFDLVSLENAGKMQKLIDEFSASNFDVKELLTNPSSEDISNESTEMVYDFSNNSVEDIDERSLMKMRKGPIKKIWNQVMSLWTVVNDSNNDKKVKAIGIGALLYLIFPLDAIPDIIPALGLTDDVAVIGVAISKLTKYYGLRIKK